MAENKWTQPAAPPPPLFVGEKERNLVKKVNDELIERVIGQEIVYYAISYEHTVFHSMYGEAINKTFLPPVRVYVLINWEASETYMEHYGIDKKVEITVHFHKRRLTEDQDLFVREGDYILYGKNHFEIVKLSEPKQLFGQSDHKVEIAAKCIIAREGLFDAT